MSVIIIDGKPGMGKTLLLTYLAYKSFKKNNSRFKIFIQEKIKRKPYIYNITQFSDYPIRFKKKSKKLYYYLNENDKIESTSELFTFQGRIFDMLLSNAFPTNSDFFIDEIQTKYDSMDYKDFPDSIAHFWQLHRHLIGDIYTCSQSQSRIIKRVLCLGEEYWTITSSKIIFGLAIIHVNITFDMHNNLESNNGDIPLNSVHKRFIFRIKKIGSMYDSKYGRYLQEHSKKYKCKMYNSLNLSEEQLLSLFFPSNSEKENIKNQRY